MKKGLFISMEGGEGSGKTSVIRFLENYLTEKGQQVFTTREPGGSPIAEQIREIILNKAHTAMDARTEALLYAAARSQHLAEKVLPALHDGKTVICDRFVDSSLVYQGYARGLGIEEVYGINRFAIADLLPDITFWLDIDPAAGMARIEADGKREVNRLDLEHMDFHHKVREGYGLLKERFPERIIRIDASGTLEQVFSQIRGEWEKRI